jgi:hypothetical protein
LHVKGLGIAVTATKQPEPTATPTESGPLQVPSLVELVDVESGDVATLFESLEGRAYVSEFRGNRIVLETVIDVEAQEVERETLVFDRGGSLVNEEPPTMGGGYQCVLVDDEERCGVLSPDGIWSLQHRDSRPLTLPSGFTTDETDVWIVNLQTGVEQKVLEGYVHCGGCDGAYGPRWAPDGEFVVFAETGGEGRRFLIEVTTGSSQQIGNGQGVTEAADWSPDGRLLLYPEQLQGETTLIDVEAGTKETIDLDWPVAFDSTGSVMYSPAWAPERPKQGSASYSTTVVDVATREALYTMSGSPSWTYLWTDEVALVDTGIGVLAALQDGSGCAGVSIYVNGEMEDCVEDGAIGQVGPTGLVAVARHVATRGHAEGPGFGSLEIDEFDVVIVDPGVSTRVVSTGLYGLVVAPFMGWDDSGTRLLIRQLHFVGLSSRQQRPPDLLLPAYQRALHGVVVVLEAAAEGAGDVVEQEAGPAKFVVLLDVHGFVGDEGEATCREGVVATLAEKHAPAQGDRPGAK